MLFDTEASTARKKFPTRVNGLRYLEFLDVDRVFDTVIEVVDLREGKLITRTTLDEARFWLLPSGRLARYREGVAGPGLEFAAVQLIVP